jgi:dihydroanticapsin dehydrogenase
MTRLLDKRILFIGGITNIGGAAVQAILAQGARVAVADIDAVRGEAFVATLGENARFFPVDVASEESITALVAQATAWLGGLDGLCQNAGYLAAGPTEAFDADLWDKVYAVNVRAQFLGVKHAIPHLRASGGGSIVNMSSLAGKWGGGNAPPIPRPRRR